MCSGGRLLNGEVAGSSPSSLEGSGSLRARSRARRHGPRWDEGLALGGMRISGSRRRLAWPPSTYPASRPSPRLRGRGWRSWRGLPHLGGRGSAASACPPRTLQSCYRRRCHHLSGGSAWDQAQSLRDPVLIPAPTPAVRLAPWTGSQTSKASSRVLQLPKDSQSLQHSQRNASCRMYPSFRVWGPGQTSASPGEEGVESLVPRLFR